MQLHYISLLLIAISVLCCTLIEINIYPKASLVTMFPFITLCSLLMISSYTYANESTFSAERVSSPASILLERCINSGTLYRGSLEWHTLLSQEMFDQRVIHLSSTPLYNFFVYNKDRFQLVLDTSGEVKITGTIRNKRVLRECVNRFLETMIPQASFSFATDESVRVPFMTPDGCFGVFNVHYNGRKKSGKLTVYSLQFEWTIAQEQVVGLLRNLSIQTI